MAKFGMWVGWIAMAGLAASAAARAEGNPPMIRWTGAEDADGSTNHLLKVLSEKTGKNWEPSDFILQENRDLAFNHYRRYVELAGGVPVYGRYIRVWTELGSDKLIQVEANLDT